MEREGAGGREGCEPVASFDGPPLLLLLLPPLLLADPASAMAVTLASARSIASSAAFCRPKQQKRKSLLKIPELVA